MHRSFSALAFTGILVVSAGIAGNGEQASQPSTGSPTFSRDVAPILYRNCVTCHRKGEIAPMSLITYQEVRPWARAIQQKVSDGQMPPWHADAPAGTFENERRLTPAEKDVISRWVEAGAPQGDPDAVPSPPQFAEGWRIGKPDAVFEMLEDYEVPASGTIQYEYFYIPTNFTEAKWLQAIEVRPGNRQLVHHVLVYYEAQPDRPRPMPALRFVEEHMRTPPPREPGKRPIQRNGVPNRLLATFAPGTDPQVFRTGTAIRLEPGGVLRLQMHYSANGKAGTDRTKVGMVFAKEPPADEIRAAAFLNATLSIPAGESNQEVDTEVGFLEDATLWGLFPHTHVRGKRWSYALELPDGTRRPLLTVPRYDFNWQTYYMFKEPISVPKGARIISSAWYDNSRANRSNPDPTINVKWGDQTWEEMQYTGLLYSVKAANR